MQPSVSIIIPTRNRGAYLPEAVESVLRQTFQDFEVLIIDDGSDVPVDATRWAQEPRVRVLRNAVGQGVSAARNRGISEARGAFIAQLDDDDLWLPAYLERSVAAFALDAAIGMVGTLIVEVDSRSGVQTLPARRGPAGYNTLKDIFDCSWPRPSGVVLRKSAVGAAGGYDPLLRGYEDADIYFRLADRFRCYFIDEPLVHYRVHGGNVSHKELVMGLDGMRVWKRLLERRPAGIPARSIRRRIARQHYRVAREYAFRNEFGAALRHMASALRLWPGVGTSYIREQDSLSQRAQKTLKPYAAVAGLSLAASPLGGWVGEKMKPRLEEAQ